jgi:putative FmdB family regulatory protein
MPIYEYRCENGHNFEAFQSMSDEALESCEVCEAPASRVLSAPAVHFKGSGFYTTDYARKGVKQAATEGSSDGSGSDSSSKEAKGSEGGGSKGSEGGSKGSDSGSTSSEKASSGSSKPD